MDFIAERMDQRFERIDQRLAKLQRSDRFRSVEKLSEQLLNEFQALNEFQVFITEPRIEFFTLFPAE